jgi:hypothetical protein
VTRDRLGLACRAARKLLVDGDGELSLEPLILAGSSQLVPFPVAGTDLGVRKAPLLGMFDRVRLGEDALPLIPPTLAHLLAQKAEVVVRGGVRVITHPAHRNFPSRRAYRHHAPKV